MESHEFKLKLGVESTSNITGFKGIITARCQHLNGCDRYFINPKMTKKDTAYPDGYWLDEGEIIISKSKKVIKSQNQDKGGFPSKIK